MARPKLIKKGNTWYRNGVAVKEGYKYYDSKKKQWMRLGANGVFTPYNVGVRTSGTKPTKDSLALQYARQDLAPSVPFLADDLDLSRSSVPMGYSYKGGPYLYNYNGTTEARQQNKKVNNYFYSLVKDSIGKRVLSGYYDEYPEQYARDIQMCNQYLSHPTSPAGWGCINSVEGLNGRKNWSNVDFVKNQRYAGRYTMVPFGPEAIKTFREKTIKPGSILQTSNYGHSIMYLGNLDDKYNADWYNTHGYPFPFENGNQIERTNEWYRKTGVNEQDLFPTAKTPGYLFLKK